MLLKKTQLKKLSVKTKKIDAAQTPQVGGGALTNGDHHYCVPSRGPCSEAC